MARSTDQPLPDQPERDRIVGELDTTMLVEAAAGTGKTTSMIGRMVELVATGACTIGEMAAVTFTRKATAELRDRFQVAMEEAVRGAGGERRGRLAEGLEHIEQGFIGTIHSFCGRLLRERPVEAGVDLLRPLVTQRLIDRRRIVGAHRLQADRVDTAQRPRTQLAVDSHPHGDRPQPDRS